ncbi:MAG: PQQ-binding-like beta-propeller repeat protein [Pseudomonadales bacterium]|nr:PQQ-binding-like beta-propeller repeat protein [Pseudomonadales bacterium]
MKTRLSTSLLSFASIFFVTVLFGAKPIQATVLFEADLPSEMKWSKLTDVGTLIVAGSEYLTHVDHESGATLWRRDDLGTLAPFNVRAVPNSPYLVVSEQVSKIPPKARLQVLDFMTGETLWDTGSQIGNNLAGFPLPGGTEVVFVREISGAKGVKPGTYLSKLRLSDGREIWRTRIGAVGALPKHPMNDSGFLPVMDLSGHPEPVVNENTFILPAGDLWAFDLVTGAEKWRVKLKAGRPNLKNTYARPLLIGDSVIATGKGRLVSLNLETGAEEWSTKLSKAALAEVVPAGNDYVVRMGGTFSTGKKLVQQKPFGLAVVSRDGELRWQWKKAKQSITNVAYVPDANLIAVADKKSLYGFTLDGNGKPSFTKKLSFKRKMGKAEVAAKSLGAVGGFLGGGLAGAAKSVGGGDRSDPPLDITSYDNRLVVRGQFHVLAYDVGRSATDWSVEFAPPGINSFALMAMGAVTATASLGNAAGAWGSSSYATQSGFQQSTANINNAYQNMASKRYAQSERSQDVSFFLTQEDKVRKLVGLNLASGQELGEIVMREKEPQFTVDTRSGTVYYFPEGRRIRAVSY